MKRAVAIAFLLLAASPASAAQAPVAIGVAQREFRITAYRTTLKPGPVRLNVRNYGEDVHNLLVRGPGGYSLQGPDVGAGERASVTARLSRPGTYILLCTRANHQQLGMRTRIEVRR